jgi:hypothetical protein
MDNQKELVGFKLSDESVSLEGQDLVGKAVVSHQGKIGSLKVTFEGKVEFIPMVNRGIDWLEQKIPGDQKFIAESLKAAIANLKIKV